MRNAFEEQRRLLSYFFDHLDVEQVARFVKHIGSCKGTIMYSGVGKSGFICQKLAASLASIGLRAQYLDPLGALHGDVGRIRSGDVVVVMSKSGATDELLKVVPVVRNKGACVIAVTCSEKNSLSSLCDMHVHLPLEKELCVFDLAPVTSTVLQLTFGDTVTALLMDDVQLTKEVYSMNHPAGSIGRKLLLRVHDIMLTGDALPCVFKETTLSDSLVEMCRGCVGCVMIKDRDGSFAGIFTDGDLRRLLCTDHTSYDMASPIELYMKRDNVRVVCGNLKLVDIQHRFVHPQPVSVMPVVERSKDGASSLLIGALTLTNALKALE